MVSVRGLTAAPIGPLPTGMVAVTVIAAVAACMLPVAAALADAAALTDAAALADAAATVVAPAGASPATATAAKMTTRCRSLMMSPLPLRLMSRFPWDVGEDFTLKSPHDAAGN